MTAPGPATRCACGRGGRLLALSLLAVACGRPAGDAAPADAMGPAVVAAFPAARTTPWSNEDDLSRELRDFQAYLDHVRTDLTDAGVQVLEWYAPEVRLHTGDSVRHIATAQPADSILNEVTYYFVEPWRIPCVLRGVQTDTVLRRTAEECFGISLPATARAPTP